MSAFNAQHLSDEYESHSGEINTILKDIVQIVTHSGTPLEGNAFYHSGTFYIYPDLYTKQLNLYWCGKQATTRICEIGFNAGHSSMLLVLGREKTPIDFTVFDIGHHAYTKPCVNYIQSKFPHVRFEYVEGDSTLTVPKWIETNKSLIGCYDVVHVDGGHSDECIINDIKNADILVKKMGIVIIDDTNIPHINKYVNQLKNYVTYSIIKNYNNINKVYNNILKITLKIKK
jgi:hypothetical protein